VSTESPEQHSIISGIGISQIGRHLHVPGLDMTLESAREAIADAGITPADIDGIATVGSTSPDEAAQALGIEPTFSESFERGGLLAPLMGAMLGVAAGDARHVLVYRTVEMDGGLAGGHMTRSMGSMGDMASLTAYHAYSAANWLAMHCRRHMALYGTTKEQLGALAVNSRANAALNPRAVYRDPITLDDYLTARPISSPFGLLDCDVPIDGSVALVVSRADHAAHCDHPVRVAAIGGTEGSGGWYQRDDYPSMSAVDSTAALWARTDLTPDDVDFAELYDGFTFLTLSWLEAFGFCGTGEAGPFVAEPGRIALDGSFPLNTYGGQISAGRMHGYWVVHEACLQLRGEAGDRQVARHEVAAVASGGGPLCGSLLLTA
jgi:acetyl-CoA acetyltransferase